jgi:hypothetical protein
MQGKPRKNLIEQLISTSFYDTISTLLGDLISNLILVLMSIVINSLASSYQFCHNGQTPIMHIFRQVHVQAPSESVNQRNS